MTKIGKKLAAVLLAVAMVITFMPVMGAVTGGKVGTQTAYAAGESTYARYDSSDNTLTFFTSSDTYTNGQTDGTVTYFADFIDKDLVVDDIPWKAVRAEVKRVNFEDVVRPTSLQSWFADFINLEGIDNIANLDTSSVTSMRSTFYQCEKLASLDVSGFDTSKVTSMRTTFYQCKKLASLDVSGFNTSKVTDMDSMFHNCFALQSLDLSCFDTSKVETMKYMFCWCKSLSSLDLSHFDTSNVKDMKYMFYAIEGIKELDLSSFKTDKVENMGFMFMQSSNLESVDLRSFDLSAATTTDHMFSKCPKLNKIYVDPSIWDASGVTSSTEMFGSAPSLPGYDSTQVDASKAVVIKEGGYLTAVEPLTNATISGLDITFTGKAVTPVVKKGSVTLIPDTDYTLSFQDTKGITIAAPTNVGTYKAKFEGMGDYTGTVEKTFKITAKKITPAVTLSAASYTWNGKVKKPSVTVKDGSTKFAASNYTVTYKNNKNVGKASAVVTMKGNYTGSKTVTFKINPKGTSLKTLTKASKAVTVKWTKQSTKMSSSRITGYQIQLATNSKFTKNKKTVTVKGYSKVSKKVTGLKGGKKYYVKIRTYKKVSGTNYYSPWSKAKTVTTKK